MTDTTDSTRSTAPDPEAADRARGRLRERLADVIQKVEEGAYDGARSGIFMGRWIEDQAKEALSEETIDELVRCTDAAHSALSRWPPDTQGAAAALQEARELLG